MACHDDLALGFITPPGFGTNSPPKRVGAGNQRTVSTNIGCNQWLSLAKSPLKVVLAGRNRSLVLRTSKCGFAISQFTSNSFVHHIIHS